MRQIVIPLLIGLLAAPAMAADHQNHAMHMAQGNACPDTALACSDKASPFVAKDGTLWLAWSGGGRVAVAHAKDGKTFSKPVLITPEPAAMDMGADARPQIVMDGAGVLTVVYSVMQKAGYNGRVYYSQSKDGGATFAPPRPITDDAASQRFPALTVNSEGRVLATWIDKRTARAAKGPYDGAALVFAWFGADGPAPMTVAQENSCECCRIAVALDGKDTPIVMWRQIFPGMVRDHAVMALTPQGHGPLRRVAEDNWQIDACPHHGPALTVGVDGTYHTAWFTEGDARKGLFYASSRDAGARFSAPEAVGNAAHNPGRAQLLTVGRDVWLAWQEFDGETVSVFAKKRSGAGWGPVQTIAKTTDASDLPVLVASAGKAYLSWLTVKEGYRLMPLEAAP